MLLQAYYEENVVEQAPDLMPMRIVEIELEQALPNISAVDPKTQRRYQRVLAVVRLHTQPLGLAELPLSTEELAPATYAPLLWNALSSEINEHCQQDGLPKLSELPLQGLASTTPPRCLAEREAFLASPDLPLVSVIIPTHDRPETLASCLEGVLAQRYPRFEVLVVDNKPSTDATQRLLTQISGTHPQVRYLREERPGIGNAANCGIAAAQGEILAFTDDDVVLDPYWLVELVRGFRQAEKVACVTGLVLPLELEQPAQFWFEQYAGFTKGFQRRLFDMKEHHPRMPLHPYMAGRFGTGASMAFTASFLKSIGGFDPALGGIDKVKAGLDIAAFFEVMMHGYRLVYEPRALLYHLHRRDYSGLRRQLYNYSVGFTSHLTRCIWERPHLLLSLLPQLIYGFLFAFFNRSIKNRLQQSSYPKELKQLEFKGMLFGPLAYLQSRRVARKALPKTHFS
ncbi:glycosyltransferase [Ktedonobacter robiniae]|uniref:Glycosyltransferase 2-like domain-containing protein n=1 Tax=Ktedonobacter robiniae TaxID=2778365 RepID=A0ABQ3V3M7_9CHLR|nr:glycosyltransferase family 2 protein [Ktedonobacter robiniae]GHO59157.1 hypothetical protein KSB_76320 [Ktedonobacter robiniae]